MSEYQVIARKWRPQNFSDVVGQEHVVRTLRNAICNGRTAHAYLFVGPRGVGKTTLARIFAKALNCSNPVDGNPCGVCESCRSITDESSLDVLEVDAASRNSTADMRDLSEDVLTAPVSGRYKIYIIDEVHMLSKSAWNVLLKTVEEPPPHVKFIFATTEVHQVLPTIISRCQRFDLLPIPTRLIAERLRLIADSEKVAVSDSAVGAIARAAEGGMRDAQSLLDQIIAFFSGATDGNEISGEQVLSLFGLTDRSDLLTLLGAMLGNQPGGVVKIISSLKNKGKNLETLFDDILSSLRAVELCGIVPDPESLIDESKENLEQYRQLAAGINPAVPQQMLEILAPSGRFLREALNKQVLLETILLKAMREAHAVKFDDILRRLNQLRSAGELKFVDQLPPVSKTPTVITVLTEKKTSVEEVKSTAVSETVPVAEPAPIAEPPQAEEVVQEPASVAEPQAEEVVQEPAPVAELQAEEVVEEPVTIAEAPAEEESFSSMTETEIFIDDVPDVEDIPAPAFNPPPRPAFRTYDASPDGKKRISIANSDPEAVHNAAKNDPQIKMIADLFDGMVIDIHRPEK